MTILNKKSEQIKKLITTPFGWCDAVADIDSIYFMWHGKKKCTVNRIEYDGGIRLSKDGTLRLTMCNLDRWDGRNHKKITEAGLRKLVEKMYKIAQGFWQDDFWDKLPKILIFNEKLDLLQEKRTLMGRCGEITERLAEIRYM